MKAHRLIALLIALFVLLPIPAYAQVPTAGQVLSAANLRSGPGTDNAIVGHASAGDSVQIAGCNADCTWYQLADGNWIAAFLVDATTTAAAAPVSTSAPVAVPATTCPSATVAANIRSGPGTTYDVVSHATPGACIVIAARSDAGDWLQLGDGNWIFAELVGNAGDLATIPVAGGAPAVTAIPTEVIRGGTTVVTTGDAEPITSPEPTNTPEPTATLAPTATSTPAPTATPPCDPNYAGACIPIVGYDLDCPDVGAHNFTVVGSDIHHFDRDRDGVACEQ